MNRKLFDRYLGEAGYPSIAEMCRDTGMLPVTISKILNGGYPILPRQKNEGYPKAVEDLCCVLCCEPDELFGDDLRKTVRHTDLSSEFSEYMFDDPFDNLLEKQMIDGVIDTMQDLTHREESVLKMRYGILCDSNNTMEEVALKLKVSRSRIMQIEAKAIKKMRHPRRSSFLRQLKIKTIQRDIEQPRDSFFDVEEPLPPVKIIKPKPKKERAKPGTKQPYQKKRPIDWKPQYKQFRTPKPKKQYTVFDMPRPVYDWRYASSQPSFIATANGVDKVKIYGYGPHFFRMTVVVMDAKNNQFVKFKPEDAPHPNRCHKQNTTVGCCDCGRRMNYFSERMKEVDNMKFRCQQCIEDAQVYKTECGTCKKVVPLDSTTSVPAIGALVCPSCYRIINQASILQNTGVEK